MRKMVKKSAAILLIASMVLGVTGCGNKGNISGFYKDEQVDGGVTENYIGEAETGYEENTASSYESEDTCDSVSSSCDAAYNGYGDYYAYDDYGYNNEEYNYEEPNQFTYVSDNPLSTFAADVDTASYSNIRRMINNGEQVNPDAVRIEEMVNYFNYDFKGPSGDEPFGVNAEICDCPWSSYTKLMMVGLQTEEIDFNKSPKSNIVLLLDVSGSMNEPDKLPLMQKAFSGLIDNLGSKDRVSIVTYAGEDKVLVAGATGDDKTELKAVIESLEASGGTAGSKGIITAYDLASKYFIKGGNNRVLLATDGDLNIGLTSEEDLSELVKEEKKSGVYLSVLGFGTGNLKDDRLETLADDGNGNYAYIDSEYEAKKVLVEELGGTLVTVAKDTKLQVEFNPAYVSAYKLIGYENRQMAAQDFNDDTKDGGEIGAGNEVVALYEIITTDDMATIDLKYGPKKEEVSPGVANGEWCNVKIRYKKPLGEESLLLEYPISENVYGKNVSDNLEFAAAVAEFGMILRGDLMGCTTDEACENVQNLLEKVHTDDEVKKEFISLVDSYRY